MFGKLKTFIPMIKASLTKSRTIALSSLLIAVFVSSAFTTGCGQLAALGGGGGGGNEDTTIIKASFGKTIVPGNTVVTFTDKTKTYDDTTYTVAWYVDGKKKTFKKVGTVKGVTTYTYDFGAFDSYKVHLVATNENGVQSTTSKQTVKVVEADPVVPTGPKVTAHYSYKQTKDTATVTFTNDSTISDNSSLTYEWSFDNGTQFTLKPDNTYEFEKDNATYSVHLKAISVDNESNFDLFRSSVILVAKGSDPITVIADFTAEDAGNSKIKITDNSIVSGITGDVTKIWTLDGNAVDVVDGFITTPGAGTYTVKLLLTVGDRTVQQTKTVTVTGGGGVVEPPALPTTLYFEYELSGYVATFTTTIEPDNASLIKTWKVDGSPISLVDNRYTFSAAGTYEVTLEVSNGVTNTAYSETILVVAPEVNDPVPVAGFSFNITGLDVTFIDASKVEAPGVITGYEWKMNGSTFTPVAQPTTPKQWTYSFERTGSYDITLTVYTDKMKSSLVTHKLTVKKPGERFTPNADFAFTSQGRTLSFNSFSTIEDGSALDYSWRTTTYGLGQIGMGQYSGAIKLPAGTYNIELFVKSKEYGTTSSKIRRVVVADTGSYEEGNPTDPTTPAKPVAKFSYSTNSVRTVIFNNLSTISGGGKIATTNWSADQGIGNFSLNNNAFTFPNYGTYKVTLTVTSTTGETSSTTQEINLVSFHKISNGHITPGYIDTNGNVFTWGDGDRGGLGNGASAHSVTPVAVKFNGNDGTTFVDIAMGGGEDIGSSFGIAVDAKGRTWSWGSNSYQQLGNGDNKDSNTANLILALKDVNVKKVSAGLNYALALDADGNVWGWGFNDRGQLGAGLTNIPLKEKNLTATKGWPKAKKIAAGTQSGEGDVATLVLRTDGKVFIYGYIITATKDKFVPYNGEVSWVKEPVKEISSGQGHFLALGENGKIYAWGHNANAEFAQGSSGRGNGLPTGKDTFSHAEAKVVQFALDQGRTPGNIVSISAFGQGSFAIDDKGQAWAWGRNDRGRLGIGEDIRARAWGLAAVPVLFPANVQIYSIASSDFNAVAMTKDGAIYSWGWNTISLGRYLGDSNEVARGSYTPYFIRSR